MTMNYHVTYVDKIGVFPNIPYKSWSLLVGLKPSLYFIVLRNGLCSHMLSLWQLKCRKTSTLKNTPKKKHYM